MVRLQKPRHRQDQNATKTGPQTAPATVNPQINAGTIMQLQQTIGNRQTAALLQRNDGPPIQRLMSSAGLQNQAGPPKEDKKLFGVTFYKMSERYKTVIQALDAYHLFLNNTVDADDTTRTQQAQTLKNHLQTIQDAARTYYTHHRDGARAAAIEQIFNEAVQEADFVDAILKQPGFLGHTWAEAIQPMAELRRLAESGEMDHTASHGTHSAFLDKFGGELLSGKELERRGIKRETGEGDFYSAKQSKKGADVGGGEKDFISVGAGLPGLGTGLAYALATQQSPDYNPAVYTDDQLRTEMGELRDILANWDERLIQLPSDQQARFAKSKAQFENLTRRLMDEARLRVKLPSDHPRRQGKPFDESTYPLVFEFEAADLNMVNPRAATAPLKQDAGEPRARGGERQAMQPSIDLREVGRLKRVYCPLDHVEEVRTKLAQKLGHTNFVVIPMEAVQALPQHVPNPDTSPTPPVMSVEGTMTLTLEEIVEQTAMQKKLILTAYSRAMRDGTPITTDFLAQIGDELYK